MVVEGEYIIGVGVKVYHWWGLVCVTWSWSDLCGFVNKIQTTIEKKEFKQTTFLFLSINLFGFWNLLNQQQILKN